MTESRICPDCGGEIPAAAPAGMCPKCLLQAGFDSRVDSQVVGATEPPRTDRGFVPPTPAELAGRFPQLEILELIGKGGMGAVYKARQTTLDRFVALKILPVEVGADPAFAERFTREARALAKLSHPNIVGVYDFGQTGGLCYFLMEYVDGANLRQTIRGGGMTTKDALAVVPQICDALQFAHDEGVVHRDIKPENILIDRRGRVKIADFGLAKLLGRETTDHTLTATHQVMGTLRYMAPEQMEGSREVDHRADIFSLGVVFYELLTGELPLGRFAPPSQRVQMDVRLDEVVLRSLERAPDKRYQNASEIKSEVEAISRSGPAVASATPRRPELAATGGESVEDVGELFDRLHGLGITLIVVGVLQILVAAIVGPFAIYGSAVDGAGPGGIGLMELIAFFVVLFLQGVVVLIGAICLTQRICQPLALIGVWFATIPLGPVGLLSMPTAIWTLTILLRRSVSKAYTLKRTPQEDSPEDVARMMRRLHGLGVTLVVAGVLQILFALIVGPFAAFGTYPQSELGKVSTPRGEILEFGLIFGIVLVHGLLMSAAGVCILRRFVYPLTVIGVCLAIYPGPLFFLGTPAAIWAFAILMRKSIRNLYYAEERESSPAKSAPPSKEPIDPPRPLQAWETHWRETPTAVRRSIEGLLALVYLAGFICFFSFSMTASATPETGRSQFTIGVPGPWYEAVTHSSGFHTKMNLLSSSVLIACIACAVLALSRRLELAERGKVHSMWWHYGAWIIVAVIMIGLGQVVSRTPKLGPKKPAPPEAKEAPGESQGESAAAR